MSYQLWAIDTQGGQAVVRHGKKWYLVSIDTGWHPTELDDNIDAIKWASSTRAIGSQLEYPSLADAINDIRSICLSELEVPSASFGEVAHLCPPRNLVARNKRRHISSLKKRSRDSLPDEKTIRDLLERCISRPLNEPAWTEFVRRYDPAIRATVARAFRRRVSHQREQRPAFAEALIDDLVQAVYVSLIEGGSKSLKGFLKVEPVSLDSIYYYLGYVSDNVVSDYFSAIESKQSRRVIYSLEELLKHASNDPILDAAASRLDGVRKSDSEVVTIRVVDQVLSRAVTGTGRKRDRDILLFKFRYYDGLPVESVINVMKLNMSRDRANSILDRITLRVREILTP